MDKQLSYVIGICVTKASWVERQLSKLGLQGRIDVKTIRHLLNGVR